MELQSPTYAERAGRVEEFVLQRAVPHKHQADLRRQLCESFYQQQDPFLRHESTDIPDHDAFSFCGGASRMK
jgi:hypothetical protein